MRYVEIFSFSLNLVLFSSKRTTRPDLTWFLKACPGEAETLLTRTLQHVLASRYEPAQLQVTAMANQLQEAQVCEESYK